MNHDKKKSSFNGTLFIIALVLISWGIPGLISGEGFFDEIFDSIRALIYLLVLAILVFVVYKIFIE
jgi:tetrahydromethanopterin S-methyltransferase subunit D